MLGHYFDLHILASSRLSAVSALTAVMNRRMTQPGPPLHLINPNMAGLCSASSYDEHQGEPAASVTLILVVRRDLKQEDSSSLLCALLSSTLNSHFFPPSDCC